MPDLGPYASILGLFWRNGVVFEYELRFRVGVRCCVGEEASEVESVAAGEADEGVFF